MQAPTAAAAAAATVSVSLSFTTALRQCYQFLTLNSVYCATQLVTVALLDAYQLWESAGSWLCGWSQQHRLDQYVSVALALAGLQPTAG